MNVKMSCGRSLLEEAFPELMENIDNLILPYLLLRREKESSAEKVLHKTTTQLFRLAKLEYSKRMHWTRSLNLLIPGFANKIKKELKELKHSKPTAYHFLAESYKNLEFDLDFQEAMFSPAKWDQIARSIIEKIFEKANVRVPQYSEYDKYYEW